MLTFGFHPDARMELLEAVEYYENSRTGLGTEFLNSINEALESIRSMPLAYPLVGRDIHRLLVKRFPYGVVYSVQEESVRIWAVMHLKRRPGYWRKRLIN